jgi:tetratricopeptide (TPR) repeat protein
LDFLLRASRIEPENKILLLDYAGIAATSGHVEKAIEVYEKLKKDHPDDFQIFQYLGITYGNSGDFERSVENLKKAVEIKPTALAYFNLAVALEQLGNLEEAAHYLRAYLQTTPEGNTERKMSAQQKLIEWKRMLKEE